MLYVTVIKSHVELWQLHESNKAYLWERSAVIIRK